MRKYLIVGLLTFATPLFSDNNDKWTWRDFTEDIENLFKSKEEGVGFAWLKIPPGARGIALADAYLSIAEGPTANWWNPAGLIRNKGWNGAFTYINHFAGTYEYIGASNKTGKNAYGISLLQMTIPDMELYDKQQHYYGDFSAYDFLVNCSYARAVDKELTLGASLKWLYERIYIYDLSTWLLDFGLIYTPYPNLWLGATAINFGPSPKFDVEEIKLPKAWKLGVSYEMSNMLFSINTDKYADEIIKVGFGVEYTPIKYFSLRTGYLTAGSSCSSETEKLSFGFGINWQGFKIDYAFKPYSYDIGSSHIITLTR